MRALAAKALAKSAARSTGFFDLAGMSQSIQQGAYAVGVHWLVDDASHDKTARLAQEPGGFQHLIVKTAQDQNGRAASLVGEPSANLDPVYIRDGKIGADAARPAPRI